MNTKQDILNRIEAANEFVTAIASRGRRFFEYQHSDETIVAKFERRSNGSLWLLNEWKREFMYVSRRNNDGTYKGFHHGGTLRALVTALVDWIRDGHPKIWPGCFCAKHWAYPEHEMREIIVIGQKLGIVDGEGYKNNLGFILRQER